MMRLLGLLFAFHFYLSAAGQCYDFADVDFTRADSIALHYKGYSLKNMPALAYVLTHHLPTDVEKFRSIYLWVCQNIESDFGLYSRNTRKRKKYAGDVQGLQTWNKHIKDKVFKNLVDARRTVCTGYAYLLEELCAAANLQCVRIDGYGRIGADEDPKNLFPNHTWNAVLLNKKWYLCDATWSSGYFDGRTFEFIQLYNDGYFLCAPSLFAKNHFPIDTTWLLLDTTLTLADFKQAPVTYGAAFMQGVFSVQPATLNIYTTVNTPISVQLHACNPLKKKKLSFVMVYRTYTSPKETEVAQLSATSYQLTTKFKQKGIYDLHIAYEDKIIATYVVHVRKNE